METQKKATWIFFYFQLILAVILTPIPALGGPYKKLESFSLDIGEVTQLVHEKSGAKLVLVQNEDQARGFAAGFKTPPYDNTGVFHVFEHVVLDGSRLYPSKSNGYNVFSSTVASLINAMTGPVSTIYPFITRNSKDFENLLSVYMDAVLFPKAIEEPRIVKREGWRYEIDPKTQNLTLNGVVLNEMKGALSDHKHVIDYNIYRLLFPNTPYAYEAGGDPEEIINLEFDQIVSAHKKYYHPQNMLIFLYGDLDFQKILPELDKNFLSHFEKSENFKAPEIPRQKEITYPELSKAAYPGEKDSKDALVKNYVFSPLAPNEKEALHIMLHTFLNDVGSLNLRIMDEKLASSIDMINEDATDDFVSFIFEETESSKQERIEAILQEEVDKVIENGLDSEILESTLNQHYFLIRNKENQSHKAFGIFARVMDHWLMPDQSLKEKLDYNTKLKKTKALVLDKDFVRGFFREHFRKNNRQSWLVMESDPNYFERFNRAEQKKLTEALKHKPLSEYKKEDELYQEWLNAEEPPEIKNAVPLLELSDLEKAEKPVPFQKYDKGSYEIIEYPQLSNGISYVQMFFDLKGVSKEDLKNLTILKNLLTNTNTSHYSFEKLSKKIDTDTGLMDFNIESYQSSKNPKSFKPFMQMKLLFLNENLEKSFSILKEVLLYSEFSPAKKVEQLIEELKANNKILNDTDAFELLITTSRKNFFPELGGFLDATRGFTFRKHLLDSKIDPKELSSSLKHMLKNIFNQKRLKLVALTGDENALKTLRSSTEKLQQALPSKGSENQVWSFAGQKKPAALSTTSEVQSVIEITSLREHGLKYSGALEVYAQFLESNFLLPALRERMGAYGAGSQANPNGLWAFFTFRDPNLKESFEIFAKSIDFMKQVQKGITPEKLKPAILGALNKFYVDISTYEKAGNMTDLYLTDSNWEEYMKTKREILETTPEDLEKITQTLEKALKHSHKAVAGNEKKIKESGCFKTFEKL